MTRYRTLPLLLLFIFWPGFHLAAQEGSVCLVRVERGGTGTGFFISKTEIVTAHHVVKDAKRIRIEFGDLIRNARKVRSEPRYDLALLEVDAVPNAQPLRLAEQEIGVNDPVEFYGHPLGKWDVEKRVGKVLAIVNFETRNQYQIDTPAIFGMSGGPVIHRGKVVSVIHAITLDENQKPLDLYAVDWQDLSDFVRPIEVASKK